MLYKRGDIITLDDGSRYIVRAGVLHETQYGWHEYVLVQDSYAMERDVFYNHIIMVINHDGSAEVVSDPSIGSEVAPRLNEILGIIYGDCDAADIF